MLLENYLKHINEIGIDDLIGNVPDSIRNKVTPFAPDPSSGSGSNGATIIATTALVVAILTVAYNVYTKYKDKKGTKEAIKLQINTLNKLKSKCSKAKDPKICNNKIQKKINVLKAKIK